jgi:hypothetical protein
VPAHSRDTLARHVSRDVFANGDDLGAVFEPEVLPRGVPFRLGRQKSRYRHHVTEIEADCPRAHQDLAGARRGRLGLVEH